MKLNFKANCLSLTVVQVAFCRVNRQQNFIVVQRTTEIQGDTFFFAMKRKYPLTPLKEKDANFFVQRHTVEQVGDEAERRARCLSLTVV